MGRYVYSTTFLHMQVNWRCSNCGKENSETEDLSFYSDKTSTPTMERLTKSTQKSALRKRANAVNQLNHEDVGRRYDKLRLSCECKHCGSREAWAKIDNPIISIIKWFLNVATFLSFGMGFASPLLMLISYPHVNLADYLIAKDLIIFGIVAVVTLAFYIYDIVRKEKCRAQIRQFPKVSLPVFPEPENSLLAKAAGANRAVQNSSAQAAPRNQERDPMSYTEEELGQLPAWKRVEIQKLREQVNK